MTTDDHATRQPSPADTPTVLAPSIAFAGQIQQDGGAVFVLGAARGSIRATGAGARISIEPSAAVSADLEAASVSIGGEFDGAIRADRVQTRRAGPSDAAPDVLAHVNGATVVAAQASAVGTFSSQQPQQQVCVLGALEGDVVLDGSDGRIAVDPGGRVTGGTLSADTIEVNGSVAANVVARRALVLGAGSQLRGTISCPADGLTVRPGARVHAMLTIGEDSDAVAVAGSSSAANEALDAPADAAGLVASAA